MDPARRLPEEPAPAEDRWEDVTPEERAELDRAFVEVEELIAQGRLDELIPADQVLLPR